MVPSEANQSIFDHNLLYNAGGSVFGPSCVDVSAKYGNLSSAPQFANAAQGDYHLLTASPGIDTGNNSALGNISNLSGTSPSKDYDGNARAQDATGTGIPIIDMGVYEHAGVVDGSPTTIILASSTYAGTPGAPLSLLASIASPLGVPTGSIAFFLDDQQIGVSILSSGFAFFNSVVPSVGAHSLYAAYQGTGKGASSFSAADSVIIIVTGNGSPAGKTYTTNLQMGVATNPQTYGQPETPRSSYRGLRRVHRLQPAAGQLPLDGDVLENSSLASASASLVEVFDQNPSTTTLSASPNTAYVGQPVTLSALVTGVDTLVPEGGSVTFYDGPTALGTETFGQYRTATLATSSLAPGVHPITAVYAGTNGFSGSTSQVVNVTILASSFTISLTPTTVTLTELQAATVAIQFASVGGFAAPLTLSYSNLPEDASATFAPLVVTLTADGTGSSTLTLKTVTPTIVSAARSVPSTNSLRGAGWTPLMAAALLLLYPDRRRRWVQLLGGRRRLLLRLVLSAGLLKPSPDVPTCFM